MPPVVPPVQTPSPAGAERVDREPRVPREDDDAAIRRVTSTYARAIETKDLALFRSKLPWAATVGFESGVASACNTFKGAI